MSQEVDADLGEGSICQTCQATGRLRPDIVWFGEMSDHMSEIDSSLQSADLFLAIGTSSQVYPAAGFVELAKGRELRRLKSIWRKLPRVIASTKLSEGRRERFFRPWLRNSSLEGLLDGRKERTLGDIGFMKRSFLLLTGCLNFLTPYGWADNEEDWRKELGASDFMERVKSAREIWSEGTKAVPFLEKLAMGEDPELASRANSILLKIKLGVTPETPEKIVALVDGYFEANAKNRVATIEKLLAAEEYDIILRLRKLEVSENVLARVDQVIAEFMPKVVSTQLDKGEIAKGLEYLMLSDQFDHLIYYGSLLEATGGLDEEIKKLRADAMPENRNRYLACLRVKGDPVLLRDEARRLGDDETADLAELALGNHVPYFESLLSKGDLDLSTWNYLRWSLANGKGDQNAAEKAVKAVVHLSKQKSEESNARSILFKMGRGDLVLEGLRETETGGAIDYHLGRDEYELAHELIGMPRGQDLDGWIKKTAARAQDEMERDNQSSARDLLTTAIGFLEGRGLVDEATQCAFALFDAARGTQNGDLDYIVGQISFGAPISAVTAVAREIDKFESSLKQLAENRRLFRSTDESLWLDSLLQELFEGLPTRDRILLTMSFSHRQLLVESKTFTDARDKVLAHLLKNDDQTAGLENLLELLLYRNREDDLLKMTEALREAGAPNAYLETMIAIDRGRFKEAAEKVQEIGAEIEVSNLGYSPYAYQRGLIMKKGGVQKGEELMEKALLLSNGSAYSLFAMAGHHVRFGDLEESHEIYRKALLRTTGSTGSSLSRSSRANIISQLEAGAATLGKWKEARGYREFATSQLRLYGVNQGIFGMRARLQILVAEGAIAMEEGNILAAVKAFSEAHSILPSDGYLANELFPVVRGLGLGELHDQLFAQSARLCRENIRRYPKDDNLYNNFAWQASRANRALDEAEGYLKIALEMNPESAAYLDTMGEIYFARRDRATANEWSEKSLQNELLGNASSRWELHQQHRRFETGEFPAR